MPGINFDDLVDLDGYTFLEKDREEKEGGGIGIYVKPVLFRKNHYQVISMLAKTPS